jgi:hypothetical protein
MDIEFIVCKVCGAPFTPSYAEDICIDCQKEEHEQWSQIQEEENNDIADE